MLGFVRSKFTSNLKTRTTTNLRVCRRYKTNPLNDKTTKRSLMDKFNDITQKVRIIHTKMPTMGIDKITPSISNLTNNVKNMGTYFTDNAKISIDTSKQLINEADKRTKRYIRINFLKLFLICCFVFIMALGMYAAFIYVGHEFPKWLGNR